MNNTHLSEEEIQLAAIEPERFTVEQLNHLDSCPLCAAKAANYAAIISGLCELPGPVISVNLQLAVMDKIVNEKLRSKKPDAAAGLVAGLAIAAIAALAWLDPRLFRLAFSGMSAYMFWLIVFTVLPATVFYGLLIRRTYRRQMQLLENI